MGRIHSMYRQDHVLEHSLLPFQKSTNATIVLYQMHPLDVIGTQRYEEMPEKASQKSVADLLGRVGLPRRTFFPRWAGRAVPFRTITAAWCD